MQYHRCGTRKWSGPERRRVKKYQSNDSANSLSADSIFEELSSSDGFGGIPRRGAGTAPNPLTSGAPRWESFHRAKPGTARAIPAVWHSRVFPLLWACADPHRPAKPSGWAPGPGFPPAYKRKSLPFTRDCAGNQDLLNTTLLLNDGKLGAHQPVLLPPKRLRIQNAVDHRIPGGKIELCGLGQIGFCRLLLRNYEKRLGFFLLFITLVKIRSIAGTTLNLVGAFSRPAPVLVSQLNISLIPFSLRGKIIMPSWAIRAACTTFSFWAKYPEPAPGPAIPNRLHLFRRAYRVIQVFPAVAAPNPTAIPKAIPISPISVRLGFSGLSGKFARSITR